MELTIEESAIYDIKQPLDKAVAILSTTLQKAIDENSNNVDKTEWLCISAAIGLLAKAQSGLLAVQG